MSNLARRILVGAGVTIVLGGTGLAWVARAHIFPPSLTGEGQKLIDALGIEPGMTVAEIGAGKGAHTLYLARRLGPGSTIIATELDSRRLAQIRRAIEAAGLTNVRTIEADERETNLPAGCCDAIFLRAVYHHLGDPAAVTRSLMEALEPGGRVAIIDFEPHTFWHLSGRPEGASGRRTGHGVAPDAVIEEMTGAGFEFVSRTDGWSAELFIVVFRKPARESTRIRVG
jgi:protein-L-isoaspartate O-methyltransferase